MTFAPASSTSYDPVHLGVLSQNSVGSRLRGASASNPVSAAYNAINKAHYAPVSLARPYPLARFWWQNGATVGTDSLMAALYTTGSGGPQDLVVCSAYTLQAGTANHCQYAAPSVQAHVVMTGASTTDGTSFVTASVDFKARPGYMYALVFANSKASAAQVASTVGTTGAALAFTSRNSQTYGASTEGRLSIWTAVPTADVTDTITIDFGGGNTQTGCVWHLIAFSNVDTATTHGVVQSVTGSGNSTTPLATLAAFDSANNATLGMLANLTDTTTTPGTNFRELADTSYGTPTNCLETEFYEGNDTTADGTITSGQWGALAAEIKSLGTSRSVPPGEYHVALWCSGTTATVFRIASQPFVQHLLVSQELSLTTGLPLTATPSAGNSVLTHHGFTSRSSP